MGSISACSAGSMALESVYSGDTNAAAAAAARLSVSATQSAQRQRELYMEGFIFKPPSISLRVSTAAPSGIPIFKGPRRPKSFSIRD